MFSPMSLENGLQLVDFYMTFLVKHHNNCGSGRITNEIVLSCTHPSHSETLYAKYKPVDLFHTGILISEANV